MTNHLPPKDSSVKTDHVIGYRMRVVATSSIPRRFGNPITVCILDNIYPIATDKFVLSNETCQDTFATHCPLEEQPTASCYF